jgi:hypothetical protein
MDSIKYPNLYEKTSSIRRKYGSASLKAIENYKNSAWIMENMNMLQPGDVATLVEYNREPSIRALLIQKLYIY